MRTYATDPRICATCGVDFAARRRGKNEHQTRFCSRECFVNKPEPSPNARPIEARHINPRGYVLVKVSPTQWKFEHTVVAEKALGRPLVKGEVVHHVNGDPQDNRSCNLVICSVGFHRWLHERMGFLYQRLIFA